MKYVRTLLLLLFSSSFVFGVTKNKPFPEYQFNKGLDTYHAPTALPEGYVQNSLNVLFDDVAPVTKRAGYAFSWGVNQSSAIVITQGVNDQFTLFHGNSPSVSNIITVPPGAYLPSSLASTITSAMSSQGTLGGIYSLAMVFSGGNFVYQSNTVNTPQIRFGPPSTLGNTLGWFSGQFIPGGAGPVYASTAPNTPIYTEVGPFFKGLWTYTDQTNTTWEIAWSSSQLTANNLAGTQVVIATVSANNTVGETNAFGNAYFVDQTQGVYYWNGSTTVYVSGSPKGSIITQFHQRLWVTGAAVPNGNQLYGSGYYAGNTWTTGLNPTDPVQYSIGLQDNFDNTTAEYVYLDTLYIFKHSSIFALYGFDQTSFQISQITQECGCVDGNTIQTYNSALEFVSLRGVESFNGYSCTRISDAIKNKIDPAISVRGYSQQSWVQSQQADWQAGTLTNVSATAAPPSLVLSTQAAFTGGDSTQANWQAGTLTNLDATTNSPNLQLSKLTTSPSNQSNTNSLSNYALGYDPNNGPFGPNNLAQQFQTDSNQQQVISGGFYAQAIGGGCATTFRIKSDNSGSPGSDIITASVSAGSFGSAGWVIANFTATTLSPSTKYWIWSDGCGNLSNSDQFAWSNGSIGFPSYSADPHVISGGSLSFPLLFKVNVQGVSVYYSSGSITSRVFDAGASTQTWLFNWGTFNTTENDNGQTITYETQVSSSASGPWDVPVAVTPGGTIGSLNKEFLQYIATFTTTNTSVTPVLSTITINTTIMEVPTGYFISQPWNVGTPISWGNFPVVESLNSGNIAFSICSSSNITMSPNSCVSQNPNTQILVATNTYVQWYATFTVTAATQTPTLNSVTVQWYTGANQPPMASTVWDNRYWLSLTTNSVDTANDAVMVLNKSGAWAQFDIHAGAFTQYKNTLYHADSLPTGNIYLDNQGWSDNGNPINAFINTRNEALGDLTSDDYMYALYPTAMATGNCTMTVAYSVDNSTTSYPLGSPLLSEFNSITSVRLPFPIDSAHQDFGQSVDFTLGTNDAQCGWQFLGIEGLYKTRPVQ